MNFEKVIFIPAKTSPFKRDIKSTSFCHRLNMVKLAIEGNKNLDVSDIEGKRQGISYSYDTIVEMKKKYRNVCLIIGDDQASEFDKWHRWKDILDLVDVYVLRRKCQRRKLLSGLILLKNRIIDISSTEIRGRIRGVLPIDYLVPERVKDYIIKNKLYK